MITAIDLSDPTRRRIIERDESGLEKREGVVDNDNERTNWVEYWDGEELVHRSVHVTLKKVPPLFGEQGQF